jgi:Gluconate 2-dehydrogenase subunit 3
MRRREFVRLLIAAAAAPRVVLGQAGNQPTLAAAPAPAPVPWTMGITQLNSLHLPPTGPEAIAQPSGRFFTTNQMATLRRLCDILLPRSESFPGAIDAGSAEFLDFYIGESNAEIKQMYQNGLDWLDAQSERQFSTAFAGVNSAQADQLLRPWLRAWMTDHLPTEPRAHFVNAIHADIRLATMNSPAWNAALQQKGKAPATGLYWLPIEPDVYRYHEAAAPASTPTCSVHE